MRPHASPPARPLYDLVKRIQVEKGWTGVQLARNAGVDRGTIENWATQPRPPLAATIKGVAERLGIDYAEALELAGISPAEPSKDRPPTRQTRQDRELDAIRQLAQEILERTKRLEEDRTAPGDHEEEAG